MNNITDIRKEYKLQTLEENDAEEHPLKQFTKWWHQATDSHIEEVNAMTLSTVDKNNKPSSRIILLKGFDENGFVFYTNYHSHKGSDLEGNPHASLVLFWKELERQVRIEGIAQKTTEEESDHYFNSRPTGSRIGAWASSQSEVITSRKLLEDNEKMYEQKFAGSVIPRPPHWGGYRLSPDMIEFWQGRPGRLHDRIRYLLQENNSWKKERLAP